VQGAGGQGEIDPGEGGVVGDFLEGILFPLKSFGDRGAGGVEGLTEGGFFLVGDVLDERPGEGECAFFPENGDAGVIEGSHVAGGGDEFEGGGLDAGNLLVHGQGEGIAERRARGKSLVFRRIDRVPGDRYLPGMEKALKEPEVVTRGGKPVSVILPIAEYEELLERLEDAEDIAYLREARKEKMVFRPFSEYLRER